MSSDPCDDTAAHVQLQSKLQTLSSYKTAPYKLLRDLLQHIQEYNIVAPRVVVKYGRELYKQHRAKLGTDVWDLYEQVFLAAMESCQNDAKDECLTALVTKFPNSKRVKRLTGLLLEGQGDYANAQGLYEEILEADECNMGIRKRLIALLKETGDTNGAVNELNKYLKVFSSDHQAWQELADLYLHLSQYELAKFCMEELLLLQPDNYLNHLQYAELMYTVMSKDSLKYARQYYAQSLELKPKGNLRALYGLHLCLNQKGGSNKPIHSELLSWSKNKIQEEYKQALTTNANPYMSTMINAPLSK